MASMMGKAKKMRREGRAPVSDFKEITDVVLGVHHQTTPSTPSRFL
jgi:hypothetical protein